MSLKLLPLRFIKYYYFPIEIVNNIMNEIKCRKRYTKSSFSF